MSKVLVTGADGFIGSHLVENLVRAGHEVRAFTMYNSLGSWGWLDSCAPDIVGQFEVVTGDIRDAGAVRTSMSGCTSVLHLAALIGIPYSYSAPQSYIETNISGTLNVVQAARDLDVERVVQTSTSEVYGTAQYVPINEQHPLVGQSPYSASKIGADQIAMSFHRSFGTPVVILRPFNTYGPRQSARAVIPTIITQIAQNQTRLRLGSLSPTRDFTFVDDTVGAFSAALSAQGCLGEVINVGSGFEISIRETANLIAKLMNIEVALEEDVTRVRPEGSEVERLWADNMKARNMLGWTPKFVGSEGLEIGIRKTLEWFSQPANLAKYKWDRYNT